MPPAGRRIVLHWVHIANGITAAGDFKLLDGPVISAAITANSQANPTVVTCGVYVPTGSTVTATNALVEASCPVAPGEPSQFFRVLEAN